MAPDAGNDVESDAGVDASSSVIDSGTPALNEACPSGARSRFGDLPSGETEHTRAIAALAEGEWLALGQPAPDPVHGRARGRAWGAKMAYAGDLGGAFLFGEGQHGWWNPETGLYMDDLWFYDARGHRWITAYPGFDTRNPPTLRLDENGFVSTDDGPLPVATMVHGYEMISYDSRRGRFMSMPCGGGYERTAIPQLAELREMPEYRGRGSPWMFDVEAMRWMRLPAENAPGSGFGDVLVYVPARDETFFWAPTSAPDGTRVSFYDNDAGTWRSMNAGGPPPPFGIDPTAAYDPIHKRIYMGGGNYPITPEGQNPFWVYDLESDTWIDPAPEGNPGGNHFGTAVAVMDYDSAKDVVLLFRHSAGSGGQRGIFEYDPEDNRWTRIDVEIPFPADRAVNAFYDACQNAHFFHVAGDSRDDGVIYAYRH
jgi:hypothetical protein